MCACSSKHAGELQFRDVFTSKGSSRRSGKHGFLPVNFRPLNPALRARRSAFQNFACDTPSSSDQSTSRVDGSKLEEQYQKKTPPPEGAVRSRTHRSLVYSAMYFNSHCPRKEQCSNLTPQQRLDYYEFQFSPPPEGGDAWRVGVVSSQRLVAVSIPTAPRRRRCMSTRHNSLWAKMLAGGFRQPRAKP